MIFPLVLLAGCGLAIWSMQRSDRRSQESQLVVDPDGSKHWKKLRQLERARWWGPILSVISIVVAVTMLALGFDFEISISLGIFGAMMALASRGNKMMLQVERITDPATRQAANADLRWRRINQSLPFIVGTIVLQLLVWVLQTYFGVSMPPLFSDVFSMLYFIDFGFGVLFVGTGLTGRLVPAEPHCFKCGYPYDTEARPVRCPECGEVLSENLIKRTRWVRSPKLIVIGAVILFFGFSTMIVQDSPFVRGAMASVVPTRGLIARLNGSEYSGLSEPALWGELQTRMPLAPKDRDRLVEELIARVDGEFTWMFLSTPGVDIWLGKELADGPHGSEHIDQALEIVENTDLVSDGAFKVNIVLKALYTTPVGALTPEQYDRLVRFSFDAVETKPFNGQMAYTIGGSAWLTAESTKGRLTPEQQVRFRNDADALAGK